MAVRSIKLKIKTRSGEDSIQLRLGLWRTHRLLNEGIAYYMNWLCLLRQDSYQQNEDQQPISKEDVQKQLMLKVRAQQQKNHWQGDPGQESEILVLLRQLYELIVPSSTGGNGDAQMLSRKFLSPLVDPDSKGGEGTSNAGRKPRWLKMKEDGDVNWQQEYEKDKTRKESDPTANILNVLKSIGIKPLFNLYTDIQNDIKWLPKKKRQFVRNWDRDMFQQAIERMLSWESWNRRVKEEREKLEQKSQEMYDKFLAEDNDWLELLCNFEETRHKELATEALEPIDRYVITRRQIRGWDRVYDKWTRMPDTASNEQLWKAVSDIQTKLRGEFGDPKVFRFLAERKNRNIWRGHPERLFHLAAYNGLMKKLSHAKKQATFTLPDPIKHPLWIRYDARGGNIHSYSLESVNPKHYKAKFALMLWPVKDGWLEKKDVEASLAPSKQFYRQIKLLNNSKGRQEVQFRDYSSLAEFRGTLGGAKIQFDRKHLEKKAGEIESGNVGPVYLNLVVDLEPLVEIKNGRLQSPIGQALKVLTSGVEYPKIIGFEPEKLLQWIKESPEGTTVGMGSLSEGMRVMTIDMGQRTSAAVSIFEVVKELSCKKSTKLCFSIGGTGLLALHRRSLLLNLPGENIFKNIMQQRNKRRQQYFAVKSQVKMLSRILRLHKNLSPQDRQEAIQKELASLEKSFIREEQKAYWKQALLKLMDFTDANKGNWYKQVEDIHGQLEVFVGHVINKWRKSLTQIEKTDTIGKRRSGRQGIAGISLWNIEELEDTRRLLVSWSKHSQNPSTITRIKKDEKFGQNLLTHIQYVREDRLKQMANLIIMTALGYKYQKKEKQWFAAYPACQLILFEDLSRYRFAQDRSRRENSKLMKWSHRSIPKMVHMQGEVYGLQVGDVYSAFSSRYHAKTSAPGIRCHALTVDDIDRLKMDSSLYPIVEDDYFSSIDLNTLKPGDLVPSRGGELFATLDGSEGQRLAVIHADINAAQNLQKRFWQQNSEVFRVPCQLVKTREGDVYIPKTESKKIKSFLGKGCFIEGTSDRDVYYWQKNTKTTIKKSPIEEKSEFLEDEELIDLQEMVEGAQEIRGEYKTLLRDPSGFFWDSNRWLPQKEFWGRVSGKIKKLLREKKY